jgi:hypothetical protein
MSVSASDISAPWLTEEQSRRAIFVAAAVERPAADDPSNGRTQTQAPGRRLRFRSGGFCGRGSYLASWIPPDPQSTLPLQQGKVFTKPASAA